MTAIREAPPRANPTLTNEGFRVFVTDGPVEIHVDPAGRLWVYDPDSITQLIKVMTDNHVESDVFGVVVNMRGYPE